MGKHEAHVDCNPDGESQEEEGTPCPSSMRKRRTQNLEHNHDEMVSMAPQLYMCNETEEHMLYLHKERLDSDKISGEREA